MTDGWDDWGARNRDRETIGFFAGCAGFRRRKNGRVVRRIWKNRYNTGRQSLLFGAVGTATMSAAPLSGIQHKSFAVRFCELEMGPLLTGISHQVNRSHAKLLSHKIYKCLLRDRLRAAFF